MKTVIITGVTGFLGRYVAKHYFKSGYRVVGIGRASEENAPTQLLSQYVKAVLPNDGLAALLRQEQPCLLVHCVGRASVDRSLSDPSSDFYANTVLAFDLLEQLRVNAPKCAFVHLSSAAVYGNAATLPIDEQASVAPISPYGFHKRQAELVCEEYSKQFGIKTASLRVFSAYGPGLRRQVLWDLTYKALHQDHVEVVGNGVESRDFIHGSDVANAIALIVEKAPMCGEQYNVANGVETPILDLVSMIVKATGLQREIRFNKINRDGFPVRWVADINKLQTLGFTPKYTIDRGVDEYVAWAAPLVRA